jgi:hypothetical protein
VAARQTGLPAPPVLPWKAVRQPGATPERVTAVELMEMEFPPVRFLVDGLLTGGLTILAGRPKHGKSWLSLILAYAVATGEALDGRAVHQGDVLYLALEDRRRRLQPRLASLRADLGWVVPETLHLQTDSPHASAGGLYHVAEWIEARRQTARLVIVDTLVKFRDPPRGSGGTSYAEDYAAVDGLKSLLDHYGVAGLVVTHTKKLKADDPFDEVTGTLGTTGAADSIWVLDTEAKGQSARLYATGRDAADGTTPLTFSGSGRWTLGASAPGIDLTARGAAAPGGPAAGRAEAARQWVRSFLREFAYPAREVDQAGRAAGHSPNAISTAKTQLGREGTGEIRFQKDGAGAWWIGVGPPGSWKRRPEAGGADRIPD